MDHLIEMAGKGSWPGACVLIALIVAVAAVVISVFGEWPVLIKKTIINEQKAKSDK